MAKGGAPYRSANAGEIAPDAHGRLDIKQFWSAGKRFKNIEPVPLSGFRVMPGSLDGGPVRGTIAALAQSAIAVTPGPHGAGEAVIWQANVTGAPCAIDCSALDSSAGEHGVQAQALVGGLWTNLGGVIVAGTAARAITFAAAPGAGLAASAVRLKAVMTATASITCGTVTVLAETASQARPRYLSIAHDDGGRYFGALSPGFLDLWLGDDFIAGCHLPAVTESVLPGVEFYSENATIGLAHRDMQTQRVRRGPAAGEWSRDLWPFDGIPAVDLGGVYAKTDDVWEISVKWSNTPYVYLSATIEGESTPGVPYVKADNTPCALGTADVLDVALTTANFQAALEALPSLGAGVTAVFTDRPGKAHIWTVTFGGALSGREYQFSASINNTADAAALSTHMTFGETAFEPLMSPSRGWPGCFGFAGDRLAYGDIKAVPPSLAFSAAGEYFDLDIKAAGVSAARLDKLRAGQVAERVLAFADASYFLVFTDIGVHFAANRTISATDPLTFTDTKAPGIVPNCAPAMLEAKLYYVGVNPKSDPPNGHQVLSLAYSELDTAFSPTPESVLAGHLVNGVIRCKGQDAASEAEASRLWLMREDGRLACACVIRSQDVLGFCEFVPASGGLVREVHVDAGNDLRLCVERDGKLRHERLDPAALLQGQVTRTPDLAGRVSGLTHLEGKTVWALAEGHVLGPFTVTGAEIELGDAYDGDVTVGLWIAPVWESLPRVLVLPNEEVVKRPGRIHSATLELIGTTSLAVGANGENPVNEPLGRAGGPAEGPPPPYTGPIEINGMTGAVTGTTLVVTQPRPGSLHVRDIVIGEKL